MTLSRLAYTLRPLVALAAASMGACNVENPAFVPAGMSTDADTSTSTSAPTDPTDAVTTPDTRPTTEGLTTEGLTTAGLTTAGLTDTSSETGDTTGVDDTGADSETGAQSGTTGDCARMESKEFLAAADAFFLAGGTSDPPSCLYFGANDANVACRELNFGKTSPLHLNRLSGGYDAMYAVRFPLEELVDLGVQHAKAQLIVRAYSDSGAPVTLELGMITQPWVEGEGDGTKAQMSESSLEFPNYGFNPNDVWIGDDGPRGASTKLADLQFPAQNLDYAELLSPVFNINAWLTDPQSNHGLVLAFPKQAMPNISGPKLRARESQDLQPRLRVHYCVP